MKKALFAVLCTVLLAACGNGYKVAGHLDNAEDGSYVYMCNLVNGYSLEPIDSAMVQSGKFLFEGETDTCDICVIAFNYKPNGDFESFPFYLEPGSIKLDYKENIPTVGGTRINDRFQKFIDEMEKINGEAMDIELKMREAEAAGEDVESTLAEMAALEKQYMATISKSILDNADNAFGLQQLLDTYTMFEPIEVDAFLDALTPKFGDTYYIQELRRMVEVQLNVAPGCSYRNFQAEAYVDGELKTVSLSDYIGNGRIVLLDFWASWCSPCREELPYIKAAYEKYHSKGFDVVSISVDDNQDEWKAALAEEKMAWPQLIDTKSGAEISASSIYGVKTIPNSFFIDENGVIVAGNLREGEYEEFLEDYFSGK